MDFDTMPDLYKHYSLPRGLNMLPVARDTEYIPPTNERKHSRKRSAPSGKHSRKKLTK